MRKFYTVLVFMLAFMLASIDAFAVTYRNDSDNKVSIMNNNGNWVLLNPGSTLETHYYNTNTKLTKIADTPYYNRVVTVDSVTLSATVTDVDVDLDTDIIIITQITGTVTAYIQAEANTPPELTDWTSDDPIIQIPARGKFDNLAVKGSGTCVIIQYKDVD